MEPIPIKPLLLSLIRDSNVLKQYIFDNIAKMSGCFVLRLFPAYHCMLNPIEIVWSQMEQRCRRQKIFDWRSLQHENFTKKLGRFCIKCHKSKSDIILQVKVIVILT